MYAVIRLGNGNITEAVVLAHTRSWMRVAAIGFEDVIELRLDGTDWVDESGEPVQFGFLLAGEDAAAEAPSQPQAAFRYAC